MNLNNLLIETARLGHTHSLEKFRGKAIHVGVDAWKYKPVSINVIAKYIKNYNG